MDVPMDLGQAFLGCQLWYPRNRTVCIKKSKGHKPGDNNKLFNEFSCFVCKDQSTYSAGRGAIAL